MVCEDSLLVEFHGCKDLEIVFYLSFPAAPPEVLDEGQIVIIGSTGNRYLAARVNDVDEHFSQSEPTGGHVGPDSIKPASSVVDDRYVRDPWRDDPDLFARGGYFCQEDRLKGVR